MIKDYKEKSNPSDIWFIEKENNNYNISYRLRKIIHDIHSPFQHIVIADSYDYGKMLILDDAIQTTEADGFIYNEMIAHVPICSHTAPKKVLIIGGGDCGAANEASKYEGIETIDMVEIDELVVKASKEYLKEISGTTEDNRINYIFNDGIKYVENCKEKYDIVIIDSSDPVGPAVKLFSKKFYANVKKILNENGILVCQSDSPIYHQKSMADIFKNLQSIYADVKVFTASIPTYPGGLWSFTMASDEKILTVPERLKGENRYVNKDILSSCFSLPEYIKKSLI